MIDSKEIMVGRHSAKINIDINLYNFIKQKIGRDFDWLSEIAFGNWCTKYYHQNSHRKTN